MGFFDDVGLAYGRTASKQMRLWAHLNTKLAKLACRRNFLLHCRTTGILPRHIVQNIKCLTNLLSDDAENNRKVPITYQYVDDLLLAIPEDRTATTLAVFNNYDPHIKFTAEEETENGVPFLDTKAIRIKKICHPDFLHNSEEKLLKIFENNGYPRMFLNRCRHSLTSDQVDEVPQIRTSTLVEPATHDKYVSLPLIPPLTGVLFSQTKDRIHTMSRSDVVYRIPCENCESVYVGQTSQCLKRRISIHKSDASLRPDRCALASHSSSLDHHFKFDEVEILCTNSNYNKRSFLEMCFINENENNINKKTDLKNLSVVYSYLLSLDRRPSRQT
ncbi:uncharacterized protein LOC123688550 isoform X2 [Harmonia axyridis]|uniref:uncharacterized protein LOC123688550 isoform X2 n=1 Tax=Harmonia axyridis TaxID=115357 RepID=UPI001E279321|nr:uncharacterized protein LOC123688550 isoform X2 [Harmonia axyridis]